MNKTRIYFRFLFDIIKYFIFKKKENLVLTKQVSDQKYFIIGMNKTGTTSIKQALILHNIKVGHQSTAEHLLSYYRDHDYNKIYEYCETADAFQDIPFSISGFYKLLHNKFPDAKFILTIRNSPDQWFKSLLKFHSVRFGKNGRTPTKWDLLRAQKKHSGWVYLAIKTLFPNDKLYNQEYYKKVYSEHIEDVSKYFQNNSHYLLIINVEEKDSYYKFCEFINAEPILDKFPWENKTSALTSQI